MREVAVPAGRSAGPGVVDADHPLPRHVHLRRRQRPPLRGPGPGQLRSSPPPGPGNSLETFRPGIGLGLKSGGRVGGWVRGMAPSPSTSDRTPARAHLGMSLDLILLGGWVVGKVVWVGSRVCVLGFGGRGGSILVNFRRPQATSASPSSACFRCAQHLEGAAHGRCPVGHLRTTPRRDDRRRRLQGRTGPSRTRPVRCKVVCCHWRGRGRVTAGRGRCAPATAGPSTSPGR